MASMSAAQSAKQTARQMLTMAQDKARIAAAKTMKGETHELDIAIVKATSSSFHVVPKEKHVRTLKGAVHPARPRREVQYVISELVHRLHHASDWLTALKTLMTMHRLMRESDISFLEELLKYSESVTQGKGHVLNMDNFIDTTNIEGRFEFSEWVRGYGKYLDEQLEVYQKVSFYQEQERPGDASKLRSMPAARLLSQLPHLQRLLQRLLDCKPAGAASHDIVVQESLLTVLKESFKVYKAISEGLINLADHFFEMEYLEAHKGLDIYKESIAANERLQQYYTQIEQIDELKRSITFPKLESPPADFLHQMEAYVKEAPRPIDEAMMSGGAHAGKKRSPPLRRGSKVAPRPAAKEAPQKDPAMAVAFEKGVEDPSQPAQEASPDLLDFDGLGVSEGAPAAGGPQAPVNNGAAKAGGPMSYTDLLADAPATNFQPAAPASNDPFASSFQPQPGFGGQQEQQQQQQQGAAGPRPQAGSPAPQGNSFGGQRPAGSNPFGAQSFGGGSAATGAGSAMGQGANPFGAPQSFGGGQQQGQGSSPFTSTTAAPAPSAMAGQGAAYSQQSSQQQQQASQGAATQQKPTAQAASFKKEGAVHDPFAELEGIPRKQEVKVSPPLRASPATSGYSSPVPGGSSSGPKQPPSAVPFSGFGGQPQFSVGNGQATQAAQPPAAKQPAAAPKQEHFTAFVTSSDGSLI